MLDYTISSDDDRAYTEEAAKITQALTEAEQRLKATDRPLWLLAASGAALGTAVFAAGAVIIRWIT